MKILAIRIKNLASLEGTTEIDFTQEPLCSAGIFAITGPTGSGKSTILDALCLALYGKTPRYAQARETGIEITDVQGSTINQSDVRAILRDGMAAGYAEVDFVGIDDQHYRANWSVRRAHGRANGSLQAATTALKNLTTGSDIGGRKTELLDEITRLVGLNYDQFTRSVLLAQGDFTAFLKADKDQKASLLEKLTGTNIYSALSKKVFERHREEAQQLTILQQRQEGIAILTTEELADLKEREAALAATLDQLQAQIEATTKEIKWHEDLSNHRAQVHEARQALEVRLTEQTQSAEREAYLRQVEQVQPTRTWVDALHEATEHLTQRKKATEEIQAQQQLLAHQIKETGAAVAEATTHLETETAAQEVAKPLLDEAKKLDTQLHIKEADVAAAQQQLDVRKAKWAGSTQRLAEKRQEAEALERQIQSMRQWKEKHASRQPVAEHHTLIVTKLTDARKQLEAIDRALSDTARHEAQIQAKTDEHMQLLQRSESLAQQVSDAQAQISKLRQDLSAIPVSQLREESQAVTMQLEELLIATTQWCLVYQMQQDAQQLRQKMETNQQALVEKEAQRQDAVTALQAITEQRKAAADMLEKARIAASADVETLRSQLADGQPCPVCGSESHPYAHQNPQLNHVLDELRKAHDVIEQTYGERYANHSQLSQAVPLLQQTIQELEGELTAKQGELDFHTGYWERYAISQASADIAPVNKEHWLRGQAQRLMADQLNINKRLDDHQKIQDTLDNLQQALERLQAQHTKSTDAAKDLGHAIQSTAERLAHTKEEHAAGNASLEDTLVSLQPHFPDAQWVTNWKQEPEAFLQRITNFAGEWKEATDKLEKATQQLDVLRATLGGIQKEEQDLATDVSQTEHDLAGKQAAYQTLKESRQSLFNGEAVEAIEGQLKQQIAEAQQRLSAQKQSQERLQTEKAERDATGKETAREIIRLEKRIRPTNCIFSD